MFKNFTLKTKLIVALLIPIFGLLYFTLQTTISDFNKQKKLIQLETFLHDSIVLNDIVHELQKERGLSAGFVSTNGKKFKTQLVYQRKITNIRINKFILNIKSYKQYSNFNTKDIIKYIENISNIRKRIDEKNIKFNDILQYYSTINRKLIEFTSNFSLINHNAEISKMIIAYTHLIKAKANSGIERAILGNVFSTGTINTKIYREVSILFSSQETYIKGYKSLISKRQLQNFNKKMEDESIEEVNELRELAFSKLVKDKIIFNIKALAGYGGFIHNFKNFILRGDIKYYNIAIDNYNKIQLAIKEFKNLKTTTEKENELIDIVGKTFDKYRLALDLALKLKGQSKSINDIDKIVKINDKSAVYAIGILTNNILGSNVTYWYNISTKRINILKSIENDFVASMLLSTNNLKEKISYKFIINSIVLISILIILLIMSIRLIYETSNSLKNVQKGLIDFFSYLTSDSKNVYMISIENNDELGKMGKMINENIKRSKIYLDEKINQRLVESQKKDKILFQQSKMVAMGEMIGNIAHQWRQPLSVISTGATGMKMQKEYGVLSDEEFNKTCEIINTNAQYLSKTIDDFRNFIKGDRTKAVFNLKEEINTFLQLVESSIKTYYIDVVLDIDNDIKIDGYRNELTQCLINIFNNAKDILIELESGKKRLVFISTLIENNDKVIIKLKDNAGGIPEDILHKIFEPYFTTKHKAQGTGLGLHMTYNLIVDGMNGSIEANNVSYVHNGEDYVGAEFVIKLPLS